MALVLSFMPWQTGHFNSVNTAKAAAVNLIYDGNFNQDISKSWFLWQSDDSSRNYVLARAYDTPYGYGPYSLSIKASGSNPSLNDAGISSIGLSKFTVEADKDYNLSFYAKSSSEANIALYLESNSSFTPITAEKTVAVGTTWTKYQVSFKPATSSEAALTIRVGSLADDTTLYLDNLNLFVNDAQLTTTLVSGYIGDQKKALNINNGNLYALDDLSIELPYVNEQTGEIGSQRFTPSSRYKNSIYFNLPEHSFSGIGKLYAGETLLGQFNYQVLLRLTEISPNPALVDEDLAIYGSGFSPDKDQNFVILKTIDTNGKIIEKWIKPHIINNSLTQMVIKLPIGVINGKLEVRNYYNNLEGVGVELKSNSANYAIKPVIYNLGWSQPGYEQIGDKITITGKGIAYRPALKFYDDNDNLISSVNAKVLSVNELTNEETIEAPTPIQLNKLKVTVKVGNYESDKADALNYTARPILKSIQSGKSRKDVDYNIQISAAKPGTTIKLFGQGFKNTGETYVEFNGLHDSIIRVYVPVDKIDTRGAWLELEVPRGAQNGQIRVEINGQKSNSIPFEIIPNVISTVPLSPFPGEEMEFWTTGVSLDEDMVTVYFQLTNKETVAVKPISLTESDYGDVIVKVLTPKAIAHDSSSIKLQSGYWTNDERYNLEANPHIDRASMDRNTKIITISGHGFSNTLASNKINYKYADGTTVNPATKMVGIKNTSEGQEITVQILDDYYYGYISLTVDGKTSNETNLGPAVITKIERRVQFVAAEERVMAVFYISGRNFGANGDVKIGDIWASTHYRTNTFIIAVAEQEAISYNPVIVTKAE